MFIFYKSYSHKTYLSFPTRRSSDLTRPGQTSYGASRQPSRAVYVRIYQQRDRGERDARRRAFFPAEAFRSEEHTSELQSLTNLVCRLLLEKKKTTTHHTINTPI